MSQGKRFYIPFEQTPPARFAGRFLEFAENHPDDPSAFDALAHALFGTFENPGLRGRTLRLLRPYVTDPKIGRVIQALAISYEDESDRLLFEILAKNPDRETRISIYKALIHRSESALQSIRSMEGDASRRKDIEENEGSAYLEKVLSRKESATEDLERYTSIARELYPDRFPNLDLGQPAPELVASKLVGQQDKLSEYRGRVVVLDIWATWCGPCRAMIPHEREMVERLKDKPFTLISISVDDAKETLTGFLSEEEMPWTHWWVGMDRAFLDKLDVEHFPTIFVLDAQGVIRARELRGEELEDKVNALLDEIKK